MRQHELYPHLAVVKCQLCRGHGQGDHVFNPPSVFVCPVHCILSINNHNTDGCGVGRPKPFFFERHADPVSFDGLFCRPQRGGGQTGRLHFFASNCFGICCIQTPPSSTYRPGMHRICRHFNDVVFM